MGARNHAGSAANGIATANTALIKSGKVATPGMIEDKKGFFCLPLQREGQLQVKGIDEG